MATRNTGISPERIRRLAGVPVDPGISDREFLHRFVARHDQPAFEALVRRHGAMVLAAARRVLGPSADADDVCQATFLILARKASARWQPSVAGWLHRTAHLLALKAHRTAARRAKLEGRATHRTTADPLASVSGREILAALDEELLALPESLRDPLVLCCLEGATRDEAAIRLGCTLATLKKRLERGRTRLHDALSRRGIGLSAVLLGSLAATATTIPARETAAAALELVSGSGLGGVVSEPVQHLIRGGIGMAIGNTIKATIGAIILCGLIAAATVASKPDDDKRNPKTSATPPNVSVKSEPKNSAESMRVIVLDPKGKPLSGASIHASFWTNEKGFKARQDIQTDAAGAAVVALPKTFSILRIWARKNSYATLFANWETAELAGSAGVPGEFTFRMETATTAGGRVLDSDGKPIVGAKIQVQLANDLKPAGSDGRVRYDRSLAEIESAVTTDAEGRWRIDNIPDHPEVELVFHTSHPDFAPPDQWTRAKKAGITTQSLRAGTATFTLKPGIVVRGRVTDPEGKPLKDAVVVCGDNPYESSLPSKFATDADGRYRLPALATGTTSVTVIAPGFAPQLRKVDVKAGLAPQDFRLVAGRSIRVRFVDAAGKPVPNVSVWVQKWKGSRSIDTNQNPNHPKLPPTGIPGLAGADGVWEWSAAPEEPVNVQVYGKGITAVDLEVIGSAAERSVTLKVEHRITGTVTDATTGRPIPAFAIIPLVVFDKDHQVTERYNAVDGRAGQLNFLGTRTDHPQRLRIEAPGYRTQDGPEFRVGEDGSRVQNFRLKASAPVTGRVVDNDGKPAARADVFVATPTQPVRGHGNDHRIFTDAAGGFTFPDPGEPFGVLIQTKTGTVTAEFPIGRADVGTLAIRPWATVRGTFLDGGKPVRGATVSVDPISLDGPGIPRIENSLQTVTGADGRFEFPRVSPGLARVSVQLGPWRDEGFRSGPSESLDHKPGAKVELKLGSGGATVTGKVKLTGTVPAGLDCAYSINYLVSRERGVPPPPAIAAAGFDARNGWRDSWSESREGRAYLATLRHWFVKLAPDGSFQIGGVPAGEYDLAVRVYAKPKADECLVDPVARHVVRVTVSAADAARGELTVSEVKAEVAPLPAIGDSPSLRFTRADGSAGTLADVRGKYAVVHFWASWCAPCKRQLPTVAKLNEQFGKNGLTVLSLSLDEDEAAWRASIKKLAPSWTQGRLGKDGDAVAGVPAYWLLDPNGKIVAKPLDADALAAEVAERLMK